jgi:hypothetical protein
MLVVGGITLANQTLLAKEPGEIDWRIVPATAIAAAGLALLERVSEELAVGLAWIALVSVLFVRLNDKPAPAENLLDILEGKRK